MRRYLPVIVLIILSPLIAEFLFGATPVSNLGGLLPITLLYGGGVVLIRELARRRSVGWAPIALLGAAYGIVEEGLALQSIFNPNLFNAGLVGGRGLGVNWVWAQWTVGYHIIWSITIPILLAELLFPAHRTEPWLGRIGTTVAAVVYAIGVVVLGVIFRYAVAPGFRTPIILAVIAFLIVAALVVTALRWRRSTEVVVPSTATGHAPNPWLMALSALVVAAAWFGLLDLPHTMRAWPLVLVPMLLDVLLVAGGALLVRRWSSAHDWSDLHRLALLSGALIPSMLWGFFFVTAGNRIDQIAQGSASIIMLAFLGYFGWHLRQREHSIQSQQSGVAPV